ncbi:aldehyde dehydrogenase [Paraliobacillus quinghaiensis]|uniref:Aldehyde dehydrogenase n=1 Tax=Paraliobacillus quinghaiensis TaxID=470815 RepID=A0A917WXL2_9BACI|nr:aldehyde dehydrogenase [Paraliobacillus quinghaiensis]GGM38853.1 aldehyde dehydrogenase [Paraliobacillus quinghaiensis]
MESINTLFEKQKNYYKQGKTRSIQHRLDALEKLNDAIKKNEPRIIEALQKDLHKSEFESFMTEVGILYTEIEYVKKHLRKWMKPKRVKTPLTHIGSKSFIHPEPYGVALIIAPWNYPFQLALAPLIGAIAAGNCAIIKPSELTPHTSELIRHMVQETFNPDFLSVVEGGVETSQSLLEKTFDYIFFTGSVPVGKIVMEQAAKHLTPVTLELGGKSPAIVHEDADIKLSAKRIAWGKFINAGQTCVAPDYLYLHESIKEPFLKAFEQAIKELYGKEPLNNTAYTHIVNEKHFNRLTAFLDNGKLRFGGKTDPNKKAIEPTVLTDIKWDDPIMADEIFGPILPVLTFDELPDMIDEITNIPKPLALYLFTENKAVQDKILAEISFGGGCINDTIYHLASPYLPFGGVGNSGMGSYHGKSSFDTFSHHKSVLKQTTRFDIPIRYPNTKNGLKWVRRLLK